MTQGTQFSVDFTGAIHKTATLKAMPKATKHVLTQWATDTVMMLKRSAAAQQRSGRGRKTGQMGRNVGIEKTGNEEVTKIVIGTGVGGTQSVKYASIQDQGGTIHKKTKLLTIPLGATKGLIRNYPGGFFFRPKSGGLFYAGPGKTRSGKPLRALFVLKDKVTLPASHWFSGIAEPRAADLAALMRPEHVIKVAERMAKGAGL